MTGRERVLAVLSFQEPDRIPMSDSPWGTSIARWRHEGMPADVGPHEYFGFEFAGMASDTTFRFPAELVEETEEYRVERNAQGAVVRN